MVSLRAAITFWFTDSKKRKEMSTIPDQSTSPPPLDEKKMSKSIQDSIDPMISSDITRTTAESIDFDDDEDEEEETDGDEDEDEGRPRNFSFNSRSSTPPLHHTPHGSILSSSMKFTPAYRRPSLKPAALSRT